MPTPTALPPLPGLPTALDRALARAGEPEPPTPPLPPPASGTPPDVAAAAAAFARELAAEDPTPVARVNVPGAPVGAGGRGTLALYELADWLLAIDARLAEAEGELTPEIEAELAVADVEFDEKADAIMRYVRERRATAFAARQEKDRLAALEKREIRAADSLEEYLLREMRRVNRDRAGTKLHGVRLQWNGRPSIKTTRPPEELPDEYTRMTEPVAPQRVFHAPAVEAAWKAAGEGRKGEAAREAREAFAQSVAPHGIVIELGAHLRAQ